MLSHTDGSSFRNGTRVPQLNASSPVLCVGDTMAQKTVDTGIIVQHIPGIDHLQLYGWN